MSTKELESCVAQLGREELEAFSRWFDEFMADHWDRQMEADIAAGKLDAAGERADRDFESGRCTPLP